MRHLARLRLATVLLDEKEYDQALKQLDGNVSPGFAALFADNRGDVLSAQGKKAEALEAYKVALARLDNSDAKGAKSAQDRQSPSNTVYRELLQQKLDSLGGGKQ